MSESFAVFAVRRALVAVATAVAVSALTYVMLRILTPESFAADGPLLGALARHLEAVFLHADLGISQQRPFLPVRELLLDSVPADVAMLVGGSVVGLVLGVTGGTLCARHPGTVMSVVLQGAATVFLCAPVYVVGFMSIMLFSSAVGAPVPLGIVAPNTYQPLTEDPGAWLRALFVPWVVVGLPLAAMCLRMVRATLPEAAAEDYVRTAIAKGVAPRRVTVLHMLPGALPPTLTLAGAYAPMLLANVILVEAVFGIPGVYRLIPGALDNRNFPVLQAIVIVGTIFVVVWNALADIALAAIDPRVRR